MSLMDKMKKAATVTAEAAKKGAGQAKEKVEQLQLRRKADDSAKQLGYLIFKEKSQGIPAGSEVDRLVAEIADLQAQLAEAESAEGAGSDEGPSPA